MRVDIELPDSGSFSLSRRSARALDVHLSTVWRHILQGIRGKKLRSFLIGGRRRVGRANLLAWLEAINDANHNGDQECRREHHDRHDRDAEAVERALEAEGL